MRTNSKALTVGEYQAIADACRTLFLQKLQDYGASWRHFRLLSVVDQIFIKARRIRRLEELGGEGLVEDSAVDEYVGIVNYCVISIDKLVHRSRPDESEIDDSVPEHWQTAAQARESFDSIIHRGRDVFLRKNHDYDEAWRDMAISSLTDEILGRTDRIKRILANKGATVVSEGVESQLVDTMNYAILALAKLRFSGDRSE